MRGRDNESYILRPGEGETFDVGTWIKAAADETDGQAWLLAIVNPTSAATPLHIHHRHVEMFHVLEGT